MHRTFYIIVIQMITAIPSLYIPRTAEKNVLHCYFLLQPASEAHPAGLTECGVCHYVWNES